MDRAAFLVSFLGLRSLLHPSRREFPFTGTSHSAMANKVKLRTPSVFLLTDSIDVNRLNVPCLGASFNMS